MNYKIWSYGLFFALLFLPFSALANITINEIAWMGTQASYADEWIELKNNSSEPIDILGWTLYAQDGQPSITISETCNNTLIQGGGYFLLERHNDNTVPGITADCIYTGALSNSGENLILKNSSGVIIDSVDASAGWPAGDNKTKETMQRTNGGWITAKATPKSQNAAEKNPPADEEPADEPESQILPAPITEEQIKADAGENKITFIGQKTIFHGKAYGLKNEPLENARFLWNFGDATVKEGNPVSHIYRYKGEYVAVLNVSSGIYTSSDQIKVKVIDPGLQITEAKSGEAGFIKLYNPSEYELDISGFVLKHNNQSFYFPENSKILPKNYLIISNETSGIIFSSPAEITLHYPNGSLIQEFQYSDPKIINQKSIVQTKSAKKQNRTSPNQNIRSSSSPAQSLAAAAVSLSQNNRQEAGRHPLAFWLIIIFTLSAASGFITFVFLKKENRQRRQMRQNNSL